MELFVDQLTVIDSSYLHPEWGVEGESWLMHLNLGGTLDPQSMVMDFGRVKKAIKQQVDALVDHTLLVPLKAENLQGFDVADDRVQLRWRNDDGSEVQLNAPEQAVCALPVAAIDANTLAAQLPAMLRPVVLDSVDKIEIQLQHETITTPYYHYSHGLKKHDGNCQRIAHGHRSKLEIWRDGQADMAAVTAWCERFNHGYLVSAEDIIRTENGQLITGYNAPQGRFDLSLPAARCITLPGDSTVECIASFMAGQLKAANPAAQWRVKAYEGYKKGAIAGA